MGAERTAVFHLQLTIGMGKKLKAVCSFRAETSAGDGRLRIAFYGDQLVVFVEDELSAAHGTVRTDGTRHLGAIGARAERAGAPGHRFRASSISSGLHLPDKGPTREQFPQHHASQLRWEGAAGERVALCIVMRRIKRRTTEARRHGGQASRP